MKRGLRTAAWMTTDLWSLELESSWPTSRVMQRGLKCGGPFCVSVVRIVRLRMHRMMPSAVNGRKQFRVATISSNRKGHRHSSNSPYSHPPGFVKGFSVEF